MNSARIPKTLHYFWFGRGPKSDLIQNCIGSWKKLLPDYRIIEWSEDNFDVSCCEYAKQAYERKKYAFVSDYARLKVLYRYGGIYLDTDVELIRNLDPLLYHDVFMGFESDTLVAPGLIIGARKRNDFLHEMLGVYESVSFAYKNRINLTTIGEYATARLLKKGLKLNGRYQTPGGVTIYPAEFFCPYDINSGVLHITENTYSIHRYDASWKLDGPGTSSRAIKLRLLFKLRLMSLAGEKTFFGLLYGKKRLREGDHNGNGTDNIHPDL